MKIRNTFLLFFLFLSFTVLGSTKFASPSGNSSNNGSDPSQAWDLAFALSESSPLVAGDSLVLLDGVYEGNFESFLNGSSGNPIVVIAQNDGGAIIDVSKNRTSGTGLIVKGTHTWFVNLKITSSTTIRKSEASNGFAEVLYESGIALFGDNIKIINCWVYDVNGGGMELWRNGFNNEVYGTVVFNNGSQAETRGTGHGFYIQHADPSQPKIIENNIVFQNASQGINIYTTNPENKGIKVFRNVSFNTGVIADVDLTVHRPPHNLTIGSRNNLSSDMEVMGNVFYRDLQGSRLKANEVSNVTFGRTYFPNQSLSFKENTVFGGGNQIELLPLSGLELRSNRLYNVHGNFYALFGGSADYPGANWDSNSLFNIANFPTPFNGLNFQNWKDSFGFDVNSDFRNFPAVLDEIMVTKNKYDESKYYVTIVSLNDSENIAVDFSAYDIPPGSEYEIIDFQNPFDSDQRVVGTYEGGTIRFPMNWSKSLQPKGNMPYVVRHTDLTFGTFLLKVERVESLEDPVVKQEIKLYLNEEGVVNVKLSDLIETFGSYSPEEFVLSKEVLNCQDSPMANIEITASKSASQSWSETVEIAVLDTISPEFSITSSSLVFDPLVKGPVSVNIFSFDPIIDYDNCDGPYTYEWSIKEITCEDISWRDQEKLFDISAVLIDGSGNRSSPSNSVLNVRFVPSDTISLSAKTPLYQGNTAEIQLGDEYEFEVLNWYGPSGLLEGQKGKNILIDEEGLYYAEIITESGCPLISKTLFVVAEEVPFPPVKDEIVLFLDQNGVASLSPEDIFTTWPADQELSVVITPNAFDCESIGDQEVDVVISDQNGNSWDLAISVLIQDEIPPVLQTKDVELVLDRVLGTLELEPDDFISELVDNCGVKEVILSKTQITCEDIGKEMVIELRAVDFSGNVTEQSAFLTVSGTVSTPVTISGDTNICQGQSTLLTVVSEGAFEVVQWRRNGQELEGSGKSIEATQGGQYEALIRFEGGCLWESQNVEVSVKELPEGEIVRNGFILIAPEGELSYQWLQNNDPIEGAEGREFEVTEPGNYSVIISSESGCERTLNPVEITQEDFDNPFPPVKEEIILELNEETGTVTLKAEDAFTSWPPADPDLEITFSHSEFDCQDVAEPQGIVIRIENKEGQVWERLSLVVVKDTSGPKLTLRDLEIQFDLVAGELTLSADDFIEEVSDNCEVAEVILNRSVYTCEDIGESIEVEIVAVDLSGNETLEKAVLTLIPSASSPVEIGGNVNLCEGEEAEIVLESDAEFEVIRWRRNGTEVQGERGKTLQTSTPGIYHAVIRYSGACISETEEIEVSVQQLPEGEIHEDGNNLTAPEGEYTYQWFRNGDPISGADERSLTVDQMGEYTVELTTSFGCMTRLEPVTLTISSLISRPVSRAESLLIFPNPGESLVEVSIDSDPMFSLVSMKIYSQEGRDLTPSVRIAQKSNVEFELDIELLPQGMYLVWLRGEGQKLYFGKLIKN
ncbi:T9SS type A sorting domain-containing protein [Algoriphagus namhaensis]|uniref:T9SS type A sorting domain-containing protein n=1 Tax=Algoriphagus namhaensis TaxID=915353 RepID=A0ABV8AV02_9BACT